LCFANDLLFVSVAPAFASSELCGFLKTPHELVGQRPFRERQGACRMVVEPSALATDVVMKNCNPNAKSPDASADGSQFRYHNKQHVFNPKVALSN
jgi:hypothetical protein